MVYESVTQLFELIDKTRNRVYERVAGLTDEQVFFRRSPNSWSIAELVEHMGLSERRLVKTFTKLIAQREEDGKVAGTAGGFKPFSLDQLVARAAVEKFEAPEGVRPRGVHPAETLAEMRSSRQALEALRPRFESLDLNDATHPHPAFGPLNVYQWIAFIGLHERRHLEQIESIILSPGFPSNNCGIRSSRRPWVS
jgi:hypothetical protein